MVYVLRLPLLRFDESELNSLVKFCRNNNIKKLIIEDFKAEFNLDVEQKDKFVKSLVNNIRTTTENRLKDSFDKYIIELRKEGIDVELYYPDLDKCIFGDFAEPKWNFKKALIITQILFNAIMLLMVAIPIHYILEKLGKRELGDKIFEKLTFGWLKEYITLKEDLKIKSFVEYAKDIEKLTGEKVAVILATD